MRLRDKHLGEIKWRSFEIRGTWHSAIQHALFLAELHGRKAVVFQSPTGRWLALMPVEQW